MATIKALNDTLYPAALAGLLVVAFTASHSNAPAASELQGATPFGADGVEYLIQHADSDAGNDSCVADSCAEQHDDTAWVIHAVGPNVTFDLVVDELAGRAGDHAVRVLLTGSELASSL